MSKTTKALAILGVVAGLGVAALPLSSYAAPVEWSKEPDTATTATYGGDGTAESPAWVEKNVGVELTIEEALQISTSNEDGVNVIMEKDATNGNQYYSEGFGVTVIANNTKGYHLQIKGSATGDDPTSLNNGNGDKIAASPVEFANAAALALNGGKSVWGYGVGALATEEGGSNTEATKFAGVTKNFVTIANNNSGATPSEGTVTPITFGAIVAADQASGTYTGQVTFRATAGLESAS